MMKILKNISCDFAKTGVENPEKEAEYIICELLKCTRTDIYTSAIKFNILQKYKLHNILRKRKQKQPLQYIFKTAYFYGLKINIQKGVFIPRPETEILVDTVIDRLAGPEAQKNAKILDLCTGSGNIAISLTKNLPHYKIFASDISEKSIKLCYKNASLHNISNNIKLKKGNLFEPWSRENIHFDAIVCNPPYITSNDLEYLPEEVKKEPKLALDGGDNGLYFYKIISKQAPFYLKQGGYLFFEVSPNIAHNVKDLLCDYFYNIEILTDYTGKNRVILARKK